MNEDQVNQLLKIILNAASRKEDSDDYEGRVSSEANKLRQQVEFFSFGWNTARAIFQPETYSSSYSGEQMRALILPPEWKKFYDQLDPEYSKYLELKKKFEKE